MFNNIINVDSDEHGCIWVCCMDDGYDASVGSGLLYVGRFEEGISDAEAGASVHWQ